MIGRENLQFAATRLNHHSSRSHCIFTIKIIRVVDKVNGIVYVITLAKMLFILLLILSLKLYFLLPQIFFFVWISKYLEIIWLVFMDSLVNYWTLSDVIRTRNVNYLEFSLFECLKHVDNLHIWRGFQNSNLDYNYIIYIVGHLQHFKYVTGSAALWSDVNVKFLRLGGLWEDQEDDEHRGQAKGSRKHQHLSSRIGKMYQNPPPQSAH